MARAGGITNAVNVGIAVQADWENREFISHISLNVRRLFEFLLQFEATTKSKLASLNEKLDTLERRLELLEVQVGTASANPSLFIECSVNQSGFIVQCQFYTMTSVLVVGNTASAFSSRQTRMFPIAAIATVDPYAAISLDFQDTHRAKCKVNKK
ncbi:Protein BRICK 1 -like protein [Gossypium arboreum]|uniref:Protein BRICK 1-like protein n=1 Tax=Gossypium arboreum TaxID=29729 RepID=A0A0B0MRG1_GOSAR|nr:Protein BRICK 1 -like protein [Gossypium arboreum]